MSWLSYIFRLEDFFLEGEFFFSEMEGLTTEILTFRGADFGDLFEILRFNPNCGVALFFSKTLEVVEGFVEGAFVSGLVADEDSEVCDFEFPANVETLGLKTERAGA